MRNAHHKPDPVGQLRAELQAVLTQVRWLKLACAALLLLDLIALLALWLTRNPQNLGL